jgi:hypothetical protein
MLVISRWGKYGGGGGEVPPNGRERISRRHHRQKVRDTLNVAEEKGPGASIPLSVNQFP